MWALFFGGLECFPEKKVKEKPPTKTWKRRRGKAQGALKRIGLFVCFFAFVATGYQSTRGTPMVGLD